MTLNIKEIVNQDAPAEIFAADYLADHVCVGLALYNGGKNIQDQLVSIAEQSHPSLSLIISDDGSIDDGPEIVARFLAATPNLPSCRIAGPQKGYAQNFLSLTQAAGPRVPFLAYCDQDDVWKSDKLARAIAFLKAQPAEFPMMYCSRTIICDARLDKCHPSRLFERDPSFENALVQNIGGGNTMVLNRAALDLVQNTHSHAGSVVSHDWWVYQLITGAGGAVIYDQEPTLYYRQHEDNLIGANSSWCASLDRIWKILNGRYRHWNDVNLTALKSVRHWLTEDACRTLDLYCKCRHGTPWQRLRALKNSGVYRQTKRGNLALAAAALLCRL